MQPSPMCTDASLSADGALVDQSPLVRNPRRERPRAADEPADFCLGASRRQRPTLLHTSQAPRNPPRSSRLPAASPTAPFSIPLNNPSRLTTSPTPRQPLRRARAACVASGAVVAADGRDATLMEHAPTELLHETVLSAERLTGDTLASSPAAASLADAAWDSVGSHAGTAGASTVKLENGSAVDGCKRAGDAVPGDQPMKRSRGDDGDALPRTCARNARMQHHTHAHAHLLCGAGRLVLACARTGARVLPARPSHPTDEPISKILRHAADGIFGAMGKSAS